MTRRIFANIIGFSTLSINQITTALRGLAKVEAELHHTVFFWAKNNQDAEKIAEGLTRLTQIKEIKEHFIGMPRPSNREVVDDTFSISWSIKFDKSSDEDLYQIHPLHTEFVSKYSKYWTKVIVYDSKPFIK